MSFDLGGAVVVETRVVADDGTPTNAATATLTITQPDGTTASPAVAEPTEPGAYSASFTPTQPGLHAVSWLFTEPARAFSDAFNVRPAAYGQIISIADAKQHMNKSSSSSVDDDELRLMIVATTAIVEDRIGPVVRRQHTEAHQGGRAVALSRRQILSIDSITYGDGTSSVDVGTVAFDAESGVLWSMTGALPDARLSVTYTVGRPVVDESIQLAVRIIVDHLWKTQRGHSARPGMFGQQVESPTNEEQAIAYYSGFALPHRAAELLAPSEDVAGGFA